MSADNKGRLKRLLPLMAFIVLAIRAALWLNIYSHDEKMPKALRARSRRRVGKIKSLGMMAMQPCPESKELPDNLHVRLCRITKQNCSEPMWSLGYSKCEIHKAASTLKERRSK